MKIEFDNLFEPSELSSMSSTIAKDLKLNLNRLLNESSLTKEEARLALLALSRSLKIGKLEAFAESELRASDFNTDQIHEARESAAIMGMLNTYYRFKHFIHDEETYKTASLRMTSLAKPVLGKVAFEMLAFAVSVINGCEMCVRSHEQALKHNNVSTDKIHDLARLAAVVKGLQAII